MRTAAPGPNAILIFLPVSGITSPKPAGCGYLPHRSYLRRITEFGRRLGRRVARRAAPPVPVSDPEPTDPNPDAQGTRAHHVTVGIWTPILRIVRWSPTARFGKPSIVCRTTTMSDAVPESTLPYPPVYKDKRFVVLSDWYVPLDIPPPLF
jgi:hypothetical protein